MCCGVGRGAQRLMHVQCDLFLVRAYKARDLTYSMANPLSLLAEFPEVSLSFLSRRLAVLATANIPGNPHSSDPDAPLKSKAQPCGRSMTCGRWRTVVGCHLGLAGNVFLAFVHSPYAATLILSWQHRPHQTWSYLWNGVRRPG